MSFWSDSDVTVATSMQTVTKPAAVGESDQAVGDRQLGETVALWPNNSAPSLPRYASCSEANSIQPGLRSCHSAYRLPD